MPATETPPAVENPAQFMGSLTTNMAATLLDNGFNINALRTNSLLRKDEWILVDQAVLAIAKKRLVGVQDLIDSGLTQPLGGLGVLLSQWEHTSDMSPAVSDMGGDTDDEEDKVAFKLAGVPIPITSKSFRLNIRHLEASRRAGASLDTTGVEVAARRVADKLESMLFNGDANIAFNGQVVHGLTTHPDRNQGVLEAPWTDANEREVLADVLDMLGKAHDQAHHGPFNLYVPTAYWTALLDDYSEQKGERTFLRRIEDIPGIGSVRPADSLAAGNVVLVQMSREVIDLAIAQDVTTVDWQTQGGMTSHFKVMAAMAPRIKSDYDGKSGVVHYTEPS